MQCKNCSRWRIAQFAQFSSSKEIKKINIILNYITNLFIQHWNVTLLKFNIYMICNACPRQCGGAPRRDKVDIGLIRGGETRH